MPMIERAIITVQPLEVRLGFAASYFYPLDVSRELRDHEAS